MLRRDLSQQIHPSAALTRAGSLDARTHRLNDTAESGLLPPESQVPGPIRETTPRYRVVSARDNRASGPAAIGALLLRGVNQLGFNGSATLCENPTPCKNPLMRVGKNVGGALLASRASRNAGPSFVHASATHG